MRYFCYIFCYWTMTPACCYNRFYGGTIAQTLYYYRNFPMDTLKIKLFVSIIYAWDLSRCDHVSGRRHFYCTSRISVAMWPQFPEKVNDKFATTPAF